MKKMTAKWLSRTAVLCLLATSLAAPFTAYADEKTLLDGETAAKLLLDDPAIASVERKPTSESTAEFPEKYDLRDLGVVTPVKFQNPWGTCWGFSAIAAVETSILSEMGKTYEETGLDLSEHHLTYFARSYMQDGSSQDGEGIHMLNEEETLNAGGNMFTATSLFSSGIGVVDEETVPYRGKNSLTEAAGFLNVWYSTEDDWSIPDEYKFMQQYELEHSEILDAPSVYDEELLDEAETIAERNEAYLGYDQTATDRMKQALMEGYAISIGYAADTYSPDQLGTGAEPEYMNVEDNKWTHYTYDSAYTTHAVTIVGWDDTIKSTDFLDHTDDAYGDGLPHQPEGDGAWIVKNSWGAGTEVFPNMYPWGIENEQGEGTGYFYLSYYDRSMEIPEIFDFKVTDNEAPGYIIDQYDYLQSSETTGWLAENELKTANVFTAEYDEILRGLSCETSMKNTGVTYEIYLMDEDAVTPADGELVLTAAETYELPGYHRLDLQEENWIEIAKDQRYAVVLTQETQNDGEHCYTVAATTGISEAAVEKANRAAKTEHADESSYQKYYAVGVVNPGESYVYFGAENAWADFADVIPDILEREDWEDLTFDNFPIKAYLDFKNTEDHAVVDTDNLPSLDYAEPAKALNMEGLMEILMPRIIQGVLGIIILVLLIMVILAKRRNKKQKAEIEALKEKLTSKTDDNENTEPVEKTADGTENTENA